jgi:hypothetical protein
LSASADSWVLLGTRFRLEASPEPVRQGLRLLLRGFEEAFQGGAERARQASVRVEAPPASGGRHRLVVAMSGAAAPRLERPLDSLDPRDVELSLVRVAMDLARDVLVLHCAAVERSGRSVLIAGEAGAGKTTLALLLHARGWNLLSDDLAVFDLAAGGLVRFPRALHLDGDYPDEALAGLAPPPEGFPTDYGPFPAIPRTPGSDLAPPVVPELLLHLPGRAPASEPGRAAARGGESLPESGRQVIPIPSAEVVQALHRCVIRSASFDRARALPLMIGLGRTMRGFRLDAPTPEAAAALALSLASAPG